MRPSCVVADRPEAVSSELLSPAFLLRLERLELKVRRLLSGERRGEFGTRRHGIGTLFREHRAYVAGDDPRMLDWNAYLRLGELLVKEFDAEESPRVLAILDCSASMGLNGGKRFRAAQELAAALLVVALSRHASVSLAALPLTAPPLLFRGRSAQSRLLQLLSGLRPGGEAKLLSATRVACPAGGPAGVAFLLSDFFESSDIEPTLRLLRHRGFEVHALRLVDDSDYDIRAGDIVELQDVETGRQRRERVDAAAAQAYVELLDEHFRGVAAQCKTLQVSYMELNVARPVEESVMSLVKRGMILH